MEVAGGPTDGILSMVIRYTANRSDVWRAYWHTYSHSTRLNVLRILFFGWIFFTTWSELEDSSMAAGWRFCVALLVASLAMLLLAVYPMLRFKKDERFLSISPSGITTTIGKLSGEVPWSKVRRIEQAGRCIYIFGTSGNTFTIPYRAFPTEDLRTEFLQRATQWWGDAQR